MGKQLRRNVELEGADAGGRSWLDRVLVRHRGLNRLVAHVGAVVLGALVWPRFVAPHRWELTKYDVPLEGLGAGLGGYRILQLTDLHVGQTKESYLRRVIERCVAEKPDLIAITGDLIDYHPRSLGPLPGLLKRIVAGAGADGVCAIFGNHDYHEYADRHNGARSARRIIHRKLVGMVEEAGIKLLRNEQMRVRRGEGELVVVGMDEMWTGRADAGKAFAGLTDRDVVLCLQHNPDGIDFLRGMPWRLMLCGHTHGGQAVLPVVGPLYVPMVRREYLSGWFEVEGLGGGRARKMYVSRGLGYSTPLRIRCRPEATVFRLVGA